jgi:hypothetical protein
MHVFLLFKIMLHSHNSFKRFLLKYFRKLLCANWIPFELLNT